MSDEVINNGDVPTVPVMDPTVESNEPVMAPPAEVIPPAMPPADAMPEVAATDVVDTPVDTTAPATN